MSELKQSISEELLSLGVGKTCCSKAFVCGLLYSAQRCEGGGYRAMFYEREGAQAALELVEARFSGSERAYISDCTRGGHRAFSLTFFSRSLGSVFADIDGGRSIFEGVGFRCARCAQSFVRGAVISSAKISRPKIGYNLEFCAMGEARAEALRQLMSEHIAPAGRVKRGELTALYFKSNQSIFDLLQYAGASTSAYALCDIMIERDMRNNANRSTNCTTSNILRAVDSNRRSIEAIQRLEAHGVLEGLGKELAYTARLRLENDSMSLAELAQLHEPPLSKSGLNSRLKRIEEMAEKYKE